MKVKFPRRIISMLIIANVKHDKATMAIRDIIQNRINHW